MVPVFSLRRLVTARQRLTSAPRTRSVTIHVFRRMFPHRGELRARPMDHEGAFLQAIREQPDDDAHRLIYADWLEEQGGAERTARAAFIRAQCRLAALSDD